MYVPVVWSLVVVGVVVVAGRCFFQAGIGEGTVPVPSAAGSAERRSLALLGLSTRAIPDLTTPWMIWSVAAAFTVAVSVGLFGWGVGQVVSLTRAGTRPDYGRHVLSLAACAAVLAFAVFRSLYGAAASIGPASADFSVPGVGRNMMWVLALGVIAAVPWITLTWMLHAKCRLLGPDDGSRAVPPKDGTARSSRTGGPEETTRTGPNMGKEPEGVCGENLALPIGRLNDLWHRIRFCVTSFLMLAIAAIVTTGALRGVYLAEHEGSHARALAFPAENVLALGAALTGVVVAVAAPLVHAWYSTARRLLNAGVPVLPAGEVASTEWIERRQRLVRYLGLNTPEIRSPLNYLSLAVPLGVAVLTVVIPQLVP
ncbi:hypothetical protein GCM10009799_05600 [Nocardiopsis rhodophaea]|uniref:Integral membrane protein n=1 Tax=Nocardiopsis rhodophaea TaxID=280238 RepID=A0ABN2SAE0_9ACTN